MRLARQVRDLETRSRSCTGKKGVDGECVRPKYKETGFSLVEVIVVMAVILIIVAISIPTIKQTIDNYRLDASGHGVASLLQQTRIQALKTNHPDYCPFHPPIPPNHAYPKLY